MVQGGSRMGTGSQKVQESIPEPDPIFKVLCPNNKPRTQNVENLKARAALTHSQKHRTLGEGDKR